MIVILLLIIVLLIVIIIRLYFDFYQQKKTFESSITALENIIIVLNQKQRLQSSQLLLSDALSHQLKMSNTVLTDSILDMNMDLFSVSFNKKNT
jgi:predicted Holliday junction resolvase-like endonuclease